MSGGRAGALSPAYSPVFNPDAVRGETRVRKQTGGGGDGGEFPFSWTWPGLINYTSASVRIVSLTERDLTGIYLTFQTSPSSTGITFRIMATPPGGPSVQIFSSVTLSPAPLAVVSWALAYTLQAGWTLHAEVTNVGFGNGAGMWLGVTTI